MPAYSFVPLTGLTDWPFLPGLQGRDYSEWFLSRQLIRMKMLSVREALSSYFLLTSLQILLQKVNVTFSFSRAFIQPSDLTGVVLWLLCRDLYWKASTCRGVSSFNSTSKPNHFYRHSSASIFWINAQHFCSFSEQITAKFLLCSGWLGDKHILCSNSSQLFGETDLEIVAWVVHSKQTFSGLSYETKALVGGRTVDRKTLLHSPREGNIWEHSRRKTQLPLKEGMRDDIVTGDNDLCKPMRAHWW